eukprot:Pgem_evm1s18646
MEETIINKEQENIVNKESEAKKCEDFFHVADGGVLQRYPETKTENRTECRANFDNWPAEERYAITTIAPNAFENLD